MKFFAIFLSVLIFGAGVLFGRNSDAVTYYSDKIKTPTTAAEISDKKDPQEAISGQPVATPSTSAVDQATPFLTKTDRFDDFRYPDSEVISETDKKVSLKSTGNSEDVVKWYKEQIIKKNYNMTNFVVTKTNGNELDKLSAKGEDGSVLVEISGEGGTGFVMIMVSVD